jgi:phosphatidate cytidylyltransferase
VAERDPALRARVLSALALVPIALAVVWNGGWLFATCVALMVGLMAREWAGLCSHRFGPRSAKVAGAAVLVVGIASVVLIASGRPEAALTCLLGGAVLGGLVAWVFGAPPGWTGLGVVYLGLPALAMVWLRSIPDLGWGLLLALLVVVWTTDTAAYVAGRGLGGPRLAPAVSPSKTWSGLFGGVLGAALAGTLTAWLLGSGRLVQGAGLGAVLAAVSQLGDLIESAFKRLAGVKDSGSLIPGHGGVLDRVDGLLLATPVLALLTLIAGPEDLPWR